jgi:cysteinyl-tRNA synthetase
VLFELANLANRDASPVLAAQLKGLAGVIGLLERDPVAFLQAGAAGSEAVDVQVIEALIARRAAAKSERNYAEADRLRAELLDRGVVLEDTAQGTTWRSA